MSPAKRVPATRLRWPGPPGTACRLVVQVACVVSMAAAPVLGGCQTLASPPPHSAASGTPEALVDLFDRADRPGRPERSDRPERSESSGSRQDRPEPGSTPSRDELARLLDEGEAAYRARNADAALAAFERVVSLDPAQAPAWLRLGNLHHQRGDLFKALAAYRRVASRSSGDGVDPGLRAKALYNLALLNLELAQQSLRALERIGPAAAVAGPREPLSAAIQAAQRRLAPFAAPDDAPARPAAPRPAPARRGASRADAQPELPRVDYIRGAPRP